MSAFEAGQVFVVNNIKNKELIRKEYAEACKTLLGTQCKTIQEFERYEFYRGLKLRSEAMRIV